jgi:hypothetical protein
MGGDGVRHRNLLQSADADSVMRAVGNAFAWYNNRISFQLCSSTAIRESLVQLVRITHR